MNARLGVLVMTLGLLAPGAALAQGGQEPVPPPPPADSPPPTPPPGYDQGQQPVTPQQVVVVQQQPAYPAPAPVQLIEVEPTVHEGFFMRFNLGASFTGMGAEAGGSDATIRGGGPMFSFALGGSVIPRLALYGELWSSIAISPSVEVGGSSGEADNLVVLAIGGGGTYYLPSNLYFGLSIGYGAASLSTGSGGSVGSTEGGVAVKATVGREWFMGTEWGIGVAGVFGFARFPDGPVDWNVGHAGVALTLTKN